MTWRITRKKNTSNPQQNPNLFKVKKIITFDGAKLIELKLIFAGAGNVLGSIAPAVVPVPSASLDPAQAEETAKQSAKVDESKPVANIQVKTGASSNILL